MIHGRHVPLAIKIAPDMTDEETTQVAQALIETGMDAVIATNTTLGREGSKGWNTVTRRAACLARPCVTRAPTR